MKKLTCGECEHWEPADNIAGPINDSGPGKQPARAGWCFYEPPKPILGSVPNALGQPQMQVSAIRPPVEDTERACASWEESSEHDDANVPIDVDPV